MSHSFITWLITRSESPNTISLLTPSEMAILIPYRRASYSASVFVAGKWIWRTYLISSFLGETSTTPAPASCSILEPSKNIDNALVLVVGDARPQSTQLGSQPVLVT